MSRYLTEMLILAIPVNHEQATLIKEHEQYYIENNSDGIENYVFLFTNNNNFYRDVRLEYDSDTSVEHFFGIEISEILNIKNSEVIKKQLDGTLDVSIAHSNYELFAKPLLKALNIPLNEPSLTMISQVN